MMAPIDTVFAAVSDFGKFERAALRRGADVARVDNLTAPGTGMTWHTRFKYRGKARGVTSELIEYDLPERMSVDSQTGGLSGKLSVQLIALSPRRTRMMLQLDLKPKTLSARLFLQTLRLAKTTLNRRFKRGVAEFAREIEARHTG